MFAPPTSRENIQLGRNAWSHDLLNCRTPPYALILFDSFVTSKIMTFGRESCGRMCGLRNWKISGMDWLLCVTEIRTSSGSIILSPHINDFRTSSLSATFPVYESMSLVTPRYFTPFSSCGCCSCCCCCCCGGGCDDGDSGENWKLAILLQSTEERSILPLPP